MGLLDLRSLADTDSDASLANRLRNRRFARFAGLVDGLPRPLRIVDVGGTAAFWEQRGWAGRADVHVTLVNLEAEPRRHANLEPLGGGFDRLASFPRDAFDVAFSNSVIEHLFTYDRQKEMAAHVRRVAPRFWVQTPNYWFPVEPHFHVPGWQWLPTGLRVALLRRMRCGWRGPCPDPREARSLVEEVRLLTRGEMEELFPGAETRPERFCGLAKSWIATGGWDAGPRGPAAA
jgi:hypothetical protein